MKEITSQAELVTRLQEPYLIILVKTHTCTVCHSIEPKIDAIHVQRGIDFGYTLYGDDLTEFTGQNLIFSSPTLLVYYEGKEVYRDSRFIQLGAYERFLDKLL